MMNLLIQNARIIDMETGMENTVDLAVRDGKIAAICQAGSCTATASETIDASGLWLFPGFLDYHVHLFTHGSTFGLEADRLLEAGVTLAVDMGSAGWVNYPAFHKCDVEGRKIPIRSYLNISPIGQPGKGMNEPLNKEVFDEGRMRELLEEYPDEICGVKVRISRSIVGNLELEPLRDAVIMGEHLGIPVCVHTTDPPASPSEIVKLLRKGDVYSHTYMGQGTTIIGENGHVLPAMFEAQRRGILLEVGNGLKNFDFSVAQTAIAEGLKPDIISSDATPTTFHRSPAMWDLPMVMSKFMAMGMTLQEVVKAVTITPAKVLGLDKRLGQLKVGMDADLCICRMDDTPFSFGDCNGNEVTGARGIIPCRTILKGKTVWKE